MGLNAMCCEALIRASQHMAVKPDDRKGRLEFRQDLGLNLSW